MYEHAEPAVAIPEIARVAPVQGSLTFPIPRPLGRLLDVLTLVGGSPAGRARATWLEDFQRDVVRLLERRPTELDGARLFLPDEVLVVAPPMGGERLVTGGLLGGVYVESVRRLARTWERYLPGTVRRCAPEGEDAVQLVAISRLGVVDVFDVDRSIAIRRGA